MFEKFMRSVDSELSKLTGGAISSHLEIADYWYADAFEDGETARQVARDALENDDVFAIYVSEWL